MIASVRWRLTLWHTAVLAVLLCSFAFGAYEFIVRGSRARTTATVLDAAGDLRAELMDERANQRTTLDAAREVLGELRFRALAFVVFDSTGRVLAASLPRPDSGEHVRRAFAPTRLSRLAARLAPDSTRVVALRDRGGGYRAAIAGVRMPDGRFEVAAASSLHEEEETLEAARLAALVAIPLALILGAVGGSLLARRSLDPMVRMRDRAAEIGATNLSERLPIANAEDEVGRLATVINELLERLERAFDEQRQFMADASHELRTPVAVIQHEASLSLSRTDREPAEYRESLGVIRDAGRRLRRLVEDLFLLARADADELPLKREPLYLGDLVSRAVREARSLAEERRTTLTCEVATDAPAIGDEALIHRVMLNLIDNAIKHSNEGASVHVDLIREGDAYRFSVEDTGPGIPVHVRDRVFERFVRADAARSRSADSLTSGAGLGLAIARSLAEAQGGRLELARSGPDGSSFVLWFPAMPE